MRVLIVENNDFNAFCLRRLLESVIGLGSITLVNNSNTALTLFYSHPFDLVIIDGHLGAVRNSSTYCNGSELAQILLHKYPHVPIIAWTDSEKMRQSFIYLFKQHDRPINDYTLWDKAVTTEIIYKTWAHYFTEFMGRQNRTYSYNVSYSLN